MFKSNSLDQYNTKFTKEGLEDIHHESIVKANNGRSSSSSSNSGLTKTPSRKLPIVIAVPATTTTNVPHRRSRSAPALNFFAKLFRTPSKSAIKASRRGLEVAESNDKKVAVETFQTLTTASSAVLLSKSSATASRTDFSGAVLSIEHSTTHSTETEGSYSVSDQKRIKSRLRPSQSYSLTSSAYIISPPFNNQDFAMSSTSPPLSRRLLAEEDMNSCNIRTESNHSKEDRMEKSDTKAIDTSRRQAVDDALLAASRSPDYQSDMFFLEKSSSSSDVDDGVTERPSDVSPVQCQRPPMTSRGISIPTPDVYKRRTTENYGGGGDSGVRLPFTRPLRKVMESPAIKTNFVRQLESDDRTNTMAKLENVEEDDDAFLPDDFQKPVMTYSEQQVLHKLDDAKKNALDEARQEFEKKISELEKEYNASLLEHGLAWRREKEEEQDRLTSLLMQERKKTSIQQQDLTQQRNVLEEYKSKMEEYQRTSLSRTIVQDDSLVARELYKNQLQEKITLMEQHLLELQNEKNRNDSMVNRVSLLQEAKDAADRHIEELEQKLEDAIKETTTDHINATKRELDELRQQKVEIVILQGEKAEVESEVADLRERLRVRNEANTIALNRLESTEVEIACLKSKLSEILDVHQKSTDDLDAANAEVERFRTLQIEHKIELEKVRTQKECVDEQRQAVLYSPQRSVGDNLPESPCSQGDILRIDNNKVQEQLKAMGKVRTKIVNE
jgi:hypothetical protein